MNEVSRARGIVAAFLTVLIWSSFIVVARASASHTLLPLDIAFLRILGAASVLVPWGIWLNLKARRNNTYEGSFKGLSPLPLRVTVIAGLFGSTLYASLAYSGFFFAPAAHASVLMPGSLPLWTSLIAWFLLQEKPNSWRMMGLFCILIGDLLVGGASLLHSLSGGQNWQGDLLFISASICWSVYTVLMRYWHLDAVRATIGITFFSAIFFLPIYALVAFMQWIPSHLNQSSWQEMLFQAVYQGVGSVVISGITFNLMIRKYGPVRSTMITALVPGLSAMGAVIFLDEPIQTSLVLGLAMVTCGILFGVRAMNTSSTRA
jgi:drug/metabolite transporter (DMT)-like permease